MNQINILRSAEIFDDSVFSICGHFNHFSKSLSLSLSLSLTPYIYIDMKTDMSFVVWAMAPTHPYEGFAAANVICRLG